MNRFHRMRVIVPAIGLFWICIGSATAAPAVKAYVDRAVVGLNQQFTLNVEMSGENLENANPELPDISKFAGYLGSSSSQSIQFVNGRMSSSMTYSFHYQAIAVGKFEIPAVTVKAGSQTLKTEPITIEIQQSAAPSASPSSTPPGGEIGEEDLYLEVIPSKLRVFQNEPVFLRFKIYTRVNVSSFSFTQMPGTAGFWVEDYPLDRQPETQTEVVNGRQYTTAVIKTMALFPMSSGNKTVDPLSVQCEVRVRRGRSRSLFDSFFDDPLFGQSVQKIIQSRPVSIAVLPLPEDDRPQGFQGVVGKFSVAGKVDRTSISTNDAVTYQLEIRGTGSIRTIPQPEPRFPADFQVYPPKVTEDLKREPSAISGSKAFEWVLVPRSSGKKLIPAFEFPFFNPETRTYQTASTRQIEIEVAQGESVQVPSGLSKEEVRLLGQDIRYIKTAPQGFVRIRDSRLHFTFWIAVLVPLLGVAAGLIRRKTQDRMAGDLAYARNVRATRIAKKRLAKAGSMMQSDRYLAFYAETARALSGYLGDKLNIAEAGMLTEDVRKELKARGIPEQDIEQILECLHVCDAKRFSPAAAGEKEMQEFYERVEKALVVLDKRLT